MKISVFIDGANFFHMQKKLGWSIDPKNILTYIEEKGEIQDAFYYYGENVPPPAKEQRFLDALYNMGYSLVSKPIKEIFDLETGDTIRKANLDVEIVLDMFNTIDSYDMAVLISGDGDFQRPLELLRARGKRFFVMATKGLIAREIRQVCGRHYIDFAEIRDRVEK
jgi:uncharacterized LabA/DUF88 family protein